MSLEKRLLACYSKTVGINLAESSHSNQENIGSLEGTQLHKHVVNSETLGISSVSSTISLEAGFVVISNQDIDGSFTNLDTYDDSIVDVTNTFALLKNLLDSSGDLN